MVREDEISFNLNKYFQYLEDGDNVFALDLAIEMKPNLRMGCKEVNKNYMTMVDLKSWQNVVPSARGVCISVNKVNGSGALCENRNVIQRTNDVGDHSEAKLMWDDIVVVLFDVQEEFVICQ